MQIRSTPTVSLRTSINFLDAKKDYLEQLGDSIENAGGIGNKQFWHFAKSVLGKNSDSCLPPIKHDGITCVGSKDKAELFNNFFISKSHLDESEADIPPTVSHKTNSRLSSLHILVTEVQDMLLALDTNKSIGPDGISPYFLKWGFQELAPSLVRLFNYSVVTCQIPNIWKTAHVIPIFKKGDKQELSNYRPVSLLSVVSKCFEKIIFKHMFNFLSMNNILTQWQSGFTPGDSTFKHLIT